MPGQVSRKSMPSRSASLYPGFTRMPSGVCHGSASPAGWARAVFSNAIFAKFGMRLIGYHYSTCDPRRSPPLLMVRMLVADDAMNLVRTVILQWGLAGQVGDAYDPAEPGFGSKLLGRRHHVRAVECPGHDLDPRAVDATEAERRAAIPAEIAFGDGGGAERGGLAAGPGEIAEVNVGEGREWRAGRLLAHPAMTDADIYRGRRQRKANGAALAGPGRNGVRRRCHAHPSCRQAS